MIRSALRNNNNVCLNIPVNNNRLSALHPYGWISAVYGLSTSTSLKIRLAKVTSLFVVFSYPRLRDADSFPSSVSAFVTVPVNLVVSSHPPSSAEPRNLAFLKTRPP